MPNRDESFRRGRAPWLREIVDELRRALALHGACIYPIVDRPDWENPKHWHNSGLWDLQANGDGRMQRVLNAEYAGVLRSAEQQIPCIERYAAPTTGDLLSTA